MNSNSLTKKKTPYILWIVGISLLVKIIALPFAQTVDADAVSRVHLSMAWAQNPEWISTSVWAPLHFYLNGLALMIWDNIVYTPKILNIIIASVSILPFFYFTRREFNENGALIASIFFALSPILFRTSFMALSETPYVLAFLISLNLISKALRQNSTSTILWAGFFMTIAAGFRYEAWLLMFIIGAFMLFID